MVSSSIQNVLKFIKIKILNVLKGRFCTFRFPKLTSREIWVIVWRFSNFFLFRFYVKLIFGIIEVSKMAILTFFETLNFDFGNFLQCFKGWNWPKSKFRASKIVKICQYLNCRKNFKSPHCIYKMLLDYIEKILNTQLHY